MCSRRNVLVRHSVSNRSCRRQAAEDVDAPRTGGLSCRIGEHLGRLTWIAITLVAISGCGDSNDAAATAAREQLLLQTAPPAPQSITAAKESAAGTAGEVTLIGRIDAGDFDPFDKQVAAFMLSEIPASDHDHGDGQTADNCPFCKRRAAKAPKAHVTLVDQQQQPLTTPAPELLGLSRGDRVVVQGRATWNDELNVLEVKSAGIYLPR